MTPTCARCSSPHLLIYADHAGGPGYACSECGWVDLGQAPANNDHLLGNHEARLARWEGPMSDSDDPEAQLSAAIAACRRVAAQRHAEEVARWWEGQV